MAMWRVDGSSLQADSQPKSVGLVWGLTLRLSTEPGELWRWLRHDNRTIKNAGMARPHRPYYVGRCRLLLPTE